MKYDEKEVEVWGTGKPVREWLYVRDFAKIVLLVISKGELILEPINIAQNHGETVDELVNIIQGQIHYSGQCVYNSKYQDGSPKKVMDDRFFRQKFPDFRFTPIDIGIAKTIEYYQAIL
jgi:GDP-L-fucose synthase